MKKSRITSSWSPDSSSVFIERQKDKRLVALALHAAAHTGYGDVLDLMTRRFSGTINNAAALPIGDFYFDRRETPIVVGALALHIDNMTGSFFLKRRAHSLIGGLVVHAGSEFGMIKRTNRYPVRAEA